MEPAGTQTDAYAVVACEGFTQVGGDTIAAIEKLKVGDWIDYISTSGGTFLEYGEGKEFPALQAFEI